MNTVESGNKKGGKTNPSRLKTKIIGKQVPNPRSKNKSKKVEKQLAKLATVTLAPGVLTLGSSAAKSGGQIGGQAFGSFAPCASFPRINSRTNIYVNPPVAPSLVGGYGFGFGAPFFDGWAWSPFSVFTPCPAVSVDVEGWFDLLVDFMCLGAIAAVIEELLGSGFDDDSDDDDDYYYY
ncbi:hypothetical protein Cgig2_028099 [Carnegiea gigantea]|uniref:Uncharacterized protein n=1 Tax=Carnegiea gigantea TaxID=171969 RepID=A0A9Q1KIY0_9CARY|nr:hypothetical protein Cgig2_028099 [Carnegiea gigantea]